MTAALPAGWRWVTLNDLQADEPRAITDGPFGSNLTSAHYSDRGPRVIRLQNIGDGHFIDAEAHIPKEHFEALKAHEARAGDLILASLGTDLPKACLVPDHLGPAIVKADCIRVRLGAHVEPRWVLYAMQSPHTRKWATDHLHGVGRPRLGLRVIRQIPVPLPPIEEQRRIVDILEDHLSRLDAAEVELDQADSRVRMLREQIIQTELFPSPGDGEESAILPSSVDANDDDVPRLTARWLWARLEDLADVVGGITKDSGKQNDPTLSYCQDLWIKIF